MILKLYEDGTIETLDTGKKINENDYMVNNLRVYADFLTEKQRLWVSYQYLKTPEGVDIKDENIYSKELLTINEKSNGYSSAIPPEVVSVPGMWGLQLFARTYSAINPNSYIEKKLSSDLYTISVYTGIPQVEDSENLSYAEVLTTLQSIENAHEKIDEINTRIDAIEAFPLEQGEAVGSLQQSIVEDGKTKGSTAHGKYSVALNKDNHAYQCSSFAVGGGNQVGMTEEEFNNVYPEGKDSVGSTYEESNSFAFVGGQQNKVTAIGAAIPGGYLNVVDGDYSVVLTGHRNTVSARYASILGGASNNVEVSSDGSTILSGIYNIVGGAYCTVGGIFNDIRSSGTVALGNNLQSDGNHGNKKVLLGSFNNPNSLAFFQLGFGTEDDRKNLVEGFENGVLLYTVTADGSEPYQIANMGAVKEYADKTYASKEYADKTYASKEYVKDTVTEALKNVNISGGITEERVKELIDEEVGDEVMETLVNEPQFEKNPLYGKKVSFIGDSICAGNTIESGSSPGGYGKIIADRNNMVYENLAKGGSTITAETYSVSGGGIAKGWICRMVDSMSADADYAIVEGGVNDAWQYTDHGTIEIGQLSDGYNAVLDDTTYYGAFESMLKKLITKFKGKKIGYIAVPKVMGYWDSNQNVPNFYHIALECCAKWGVSVCDLNTIVPPLLLAGSEYTADGTHPTYEGYLKYYCDPIEEWMKTLTSGGNNAAFVALKAIEEYIKGFNDAIKALQDGKLDNTGISFKKALLPLADGTTIEIDVLTAIDGTVIIPYINQVPISIDTDGSVYNGCGYEADKRLSSSGVAKSQSNSYVTGYIPAKGGDVVRIVGCDWGTTAHAFNYICAYDSNFGFIGGLATVGGATNLTAHGTNIKGDYVRDADTLDATITLANISNIAYVRVSSCGDNTTGFDMYDIADMIITVNEEIV